MKKVIIFLSVLLFNSASLGETIYCVGPGLCSLVKKMVAPKLLNNIQFEELPVEIGQQDLKKYGELFKKKSLLFTFPPAGLGDWSSLILKKHYDFPHSVFSMRLGGLLPLIYRDKNKEPDFTVLNKENSPYLPFYFYPYSLSNTAMDIYIFLKTFTPLARKKLPAIFAIDNVTYMLEDCLQNHARINQVTYIFPDKVLSSFFNHLSIDLRVSKEVFKDIPPESLKNSQKIIFFNFKGDRTLAIKRYGESKTRFWDWEIFPKTPFLDPNIYLQQTVLAAFKAAEIDSKKVCY